MLVLPARERINLAIDTKDLDEAERFAKLAQQAGARFIKLGLGFATANSWEEGSDLAEDLGLEWAADAKLDDIPNTVKDAVESLKNLDHPPFAITMHIKAGIEAMRVAQEAAGDILMLGVTELTSIPPEETYKRYSIKRANLVMLLAHDAVTAGLKGIVASPKEVGEIKSNPVTKSLFAMIPGTRSLGTDVHDQANVDTPAAAIRDGADLLVIGRQITKAEDPLRAYEELVAEIEGAL